jgi:hypothetical protein
MRADQTRAWFVRLAMQWAEIGSLTAATSGIERSSAAGVLARRSSRSASKCCMPPTPVTTTTLASLMVRPLLMADRLGSL